MPQLETNLSSYLTRIRRYLHEIDPDPSFWSQNFLRQMFNTSYRRRCAQLMMAYEGWFTLVATANLTADQSTYAFPTGLQRLLKLELVRTDGRTVPLMRWERHDEINPSSEQSASGDDYLPNFRPLSNGFVLEPTPIETVTNGLRIEYSGLPAELEGNNDAIHPSFPNILDELLVLDTALLALQAEGIHEAGPVASLFRARAEWEADWERFIDGRTIHRDAIDPFIPHSYDA